MISASSTGYRVSSPHPSFQIAFLTGQSRPSSCALSPVQHVFLERLAAATGTIAVPANYPYHGRDGTWRPTFLPVASLRNAVQFLRALRRRGVGRSRAFFGVSALLEQAGHTVFLAGSCGLQLLVALDLPEVLLARCSFVAFGPVAVERPACPGLVVTGRRDWVAWRHRLRADHTVECGHLGYLENRDFPAICAGFVREQQARVRRAGHAAAL